MANKLQNVLATLAATVTGNRKSEGVDEILAQFTSAADRLDAVEAQMDARTDAINGEIDDLEAERSVVEGEAQRAFTAARKIRNLFS